MKRIILFLIPAIVLLLSANPCQGNSADFQEAARNGQLANEGFRRCTKYVHDWLKYSDPTTGLIPGNLSNDRDIWNVHNAAADNYPFMVLTAAITDAPLFKGRMLDMLKTEEEVTSRLGHLPDAYSFSKKTFQDEQADNERILFGASEYVKDGLLPLTEWLGESPWSERMFDLIDDTWAHAAIPTKYGLIPSKNVEVNGEQLQVLSRVYWMTRERKYLDWAIRLGDYYLLDHQHPTRDFDVLRLRNHGCEIVSGLCELYVTVHFASQEKKKQYEQPIHEMLNRILEIGRNEDGMFYNSVNPKTGQTIDEGISDTWGYVFNAFYTVYLIDKTDAYRDAILLALSHLNRYRNFDWEQGAADGFADAIEGAINLYNREALSHVKEWIDGETKILWSLQDTSYRKEA